MFEFFKRKKPQTETRSSYSDFQSVIFGGGSNDHVSKNEATSLIAVRACVDIIAETIGSMSLHVYQSNDDDARQRAKYHPIYNLLHSEPNPDMTSVSWLESVYRRLLLDGNSYDYIEMKNGRPVAIYPLLNCRAIRINGNLIYRTKVDSKNIDLNQSQILHLVDYSYDGINGISRIQMCARSVGVAISSEKFAKSFFENGTVSNLSLEFPQKLDEPQLKETQRRFEEKHQGTQNAHKLMILHNGAKANVLNMSAENAQLIERLKLSSVDIARLFKVPPHLVGIEGSSSLASVEQQGINFYKNTIRPLLIKLESELNRKLFFENEKDNFYAEFDPASLLRGDSVAQDTSHKTAIQFGWLSVNEVRHQRNMPPIEGGDKHLFPLNMSQFEPLEGTILNDIPIIEPLKIEEKKIDFKPIIKAQIERLITKEIKAIERKISLPDVEFREWLKEFYDKHEKTTSDVLLPILKSMNRENELTEQVNRYIKRQYEDVLNADDKMKVISNWNLTINNLVGELWQNEN